MTARRRRACARAPKRCRPCFRRSPKADPELNEKPTMRRPQRLIAATVLVALSSALAGSGSMGNFDPSDLLDFLDTKKKLPGDRKPVFPDGVPGLEQGVPRDLYKENVERQRAQEAAPVAAAPLQPPPGAPEPKGRKAKSRGSVQVGTVRQDGAAPADPDAAPTEEGSTAAAPPPPQGRRSPAAAALPRRRRMSRQQPRRPSRPPHRSRHQCRRAVSRAEFARPLIDRLSVKGARITYVLYHCHHRPTQCRQVHAVQPSGRAEACAGR